MSDLRVGSHVFIHGLVSEAGQRLNLRSGRVVAQGERLGVAVQGESPKRLKRANLLSADRTEDRTLMLQLLALWRMRLVMPALKHLLKDDLGLILLVSSYVSEPVQGLFHFGGFMRRIWMENWCFRPGGAPKALAQQEAPRLDAASCHLGLGRVLFAGGCRKHPQLCEHDDFFNSAELYDCLTDTWQSLPAMPTRRHGATACELRGKAYVLGGMYVDERAIPVEEKFCDVLDTSSWQWKPLDSNAYRHLPMEELLDHSAFFGAAAVSGRLVALMGSTTLAYNPTMPEDGWRVCGTMEGIEVGASSCCSGLRGDFVVASGRPAVLARKAARFSFNEAASHAQWFRGTWHQLPDLHLSRVGGAMAVLDDTLYITGGVDEVTGQFQDTAEQLAPDMSSWISVPWFQMPRALHAHDAFALPLL